MEKEIASPLHNPSHFPSPPQRSFKLLLHIQNTDKNYTYGLTDVSKVALDDILGRKLEDARLSGTRKRAPKKSKKP